MCTYVIIIINYYRYWYACKPMRRSSYGNIEIELRNPQPNQRRALYTGDGDWFSIVFTLRIDGPLIGGWEITICLLNWPVISSPRVITAFKCQSIRAATAHLAKLRPTIRVYILRYPLKTCKNYKFFSKFICEISSIRFLFSV